EIAEAEGKSLIAKHLERARNEIEDAARDEPQEEAADETKEAVRARGGVHIVLPEHVLPAGDDGDGAAQPDRPGCVTVPYDDALYEQAAADPDLHTSGQSLTRGDLDEVAEFTWPVLRPDPWTAADSWESSGGGSTTFFPDRLGAPSKPVNKD